MTILKSIILGGALLSLSSLATAAEKVVTLDVDNMTCMSCPYQVKSALKGVEGVIDAEASLDSGQAVVTYDDAVTDTMALTKATANAGYPSREAKTAVN